jgi:hypothetical protein
MESYQPNVTDNSQNHTTMIDGFAGLESRTFEKLKEDDTQTINIME